MFLLYIVWFVLQSTELKRDMQMKNQNINPRLLKIFFVTPFITTPL